MIDYFQTSSDILTSRLIEHIEISGLSLFFALLLAVFVTVLLRFYPQWRHFSVYALSLLYAVPSFALFALLIPWTGLGRTTAIVVLVLYAQYTLVRTFLAGLLSVDDSVIEAAVGMGMTDWQILYHIQLPLAKASIFAGIRLAATSIIAMATIAATINAGGLGAVLFDGLRTRSFPKLLWGILLTVALSLLVNLVLYLIEELLQNNKVSQPAPH